MWNLKPPVTENDLREYAEKEIERSFTLLNLQHYLVDTTLDFDEEERRIYLNVNFADEMAIESFEIRFNVPENYEYEGVDEVLKQANDDAGDVLTKFGKLGI